jgi:ribonuclease P protein subunit RPR2
MTRKRAELRELEKRIAKERIVNLMRSATVSDLQLANRYVSRAWKLSLRFKVSIPRMLKRLFCKKCLTFWRSGKTCTVRVRNKVQIIVCRGCKRIARFPLA